VSIYQKSHSVGPFSNPGYTRHDNLTFSTSIALVGNHGGCLLRGERGFRGGGWWCLRGRRWECQRRWEYE